MRGTVFPQAVCLPSCSTKKPSHKSENINRLITSALICKSYWFSLLPLPAHLLYPFVDVSKGRENQGGGGGGSEFSHKISQGRNEVLIKKAGVLCKWLMLRRQPNECARSGWGAFAARRQLAPRKVRRRRARGSIILQIGSSAPWSPFDYLPNCCISQR